MTREENQPQHPDRTEPVAPPAAEAVLRFASLKRGALFAGRYEIQGLLGTGGAGEVYRVKDRLSEGEAALKVLFPRAEQGQRPLERLRRELRIVRGLNHPGIVRLHDLGESDGLLFLVMELLEGETLKARLAREKRLPPQEARRILTGVLEGLAAAHAAGAVHRDVKPGNIILSGERVVLLDFGLARTAPDLRLTATGQFMGTPEYVSPEQARGDRDVSPASDIYSAGIVLWEMLAGSPPFFGDSAVSIVAAHLSKPLPAPRRAFASAPRFLRDLSAWMLEKDSARRPADAGVVLNSLSTGSGAPWHRRLPRVRWVAAISVVVALSFVAFFPVRPRFEGSNIKAASLAGIPVISRPTPGVVLNPLPLGGAFFPRKYLLMTDSTMVDGANGEDPFPPTFLSTFDVWTGRLAPFQLLPEDLWRNGPPHGIPRFDHRMKVQKLVRAPWSAVGGSKLQVVVYRHWDQFPAVAAEFDERGRTRWVLGHPGLIEQQVQFVPKAGHDLILFHGINNRLGRRRVVWAIEETPFEVPNAGTISVPPFESPGSNRGRLAYYLLLSTINPLEMTIAGENGRLTSDDGLAFEFDPRTGVPRDPKVLEGLDPGSWVSVHEELFGRLSQAAVSESKDQPDPQPLLEFAERITVPRAARGVALARAAELLRATGRLSEGYAAARRALELEPGIAGHARLVMDLGVRIGDFRRWQKDCDQLALPRLVNQEVGRDRIVAALAGNDEKQAGKWVAASDSSYGIWERALIALHTGKYEEAVFALEQEAHQRPEFAFLRAIALAHLPRPQCAAARKDLLFAMSGEGCGWALPFLPLEAFLARRCGGAPPPREKIEAALHVQRRAARNNIVDLYFVPWGEHLAYGTPLNWGTELVRKVHPP